jgi:hypothetical protein
VDDFNRRGDTVNGREGSRPPGSRLGDFGGRLARAFSRSEPAEPGLGVYDHVDHWVDDEPPLPPDEAIARFPITRQGYDPATVDEHVAYLEQELVELDGQLAELRAQTPSRGDVTAEIERIGGQTSAILIAAHDQADETRRIAQEQADRCMADAASNAIATTSAANRELRELESEQASLSRERERLLEDIRGIATTLSSLADSAAERFPPEPENPGPPPVVEPEPTV